MTSDVATLLATPLHDVAASRTLFAALMAMAEQRGITLRSPPPEPTSCCGRGCNGCVWEGFFDAAAYWRDEAALLITNEGAK